MKIISILGSTGSIGKSTLSVINLHPEKFKVFALAGFNNVDLLLEQTIKFKPSFIVTKDLVSKKQLMDKLKETKLDTVILYGNDGYSFIASHEEVTTVVAAITGSAGLISTIDAAKSGKQILLANKESMVMAGDLINKICSENNSTLIPVDSEHNAIFQVFSNNSDTKKIKKVILTASGGPFRGFTSDMLASVTKADALKHPNWSMGAKITIDSASMMNKGLEVIEAKWLFDLNKDQIDIIVHPQSIIHSIVQFEDGSMKAQMGLPDMKLPIQYALTYPRRLKNTFPRFDFLDYPSLTFEKPDFKAFRNLNLAFDALAKEGNAPAVLNAANEVAVARFLNDQIAFVQLPDVVEYALSRVSYQSKPDLEAHLESDKEARAFALEF